MRPGAHARRHCQGSLRLSSTTKLSEVSPCFKCAPDVSAATGTCHRIHAMLAFVPSSARFAAIARAGASPGHAPTAAENCSRDHHGRPPSLRSTQARLRGCSSPKVARQHLDFPSAARSRRRLVAARTSHSAIAAKSQQERTWSSSQSPPVA